LRSHPLAAMRSISLTSPTIQLSSWLSPSTLFPELADKFMMSVERVAAGLGADKPF
jgi:hypothetical protein